MIVRLLACVALVACPLPALAEEWPLPLETRAGEPFLHANSGITLPVRLIDLPRTAAREYAAPQLDVLFTYKDVEAREELSVYIYRVTAGIPAIWFEQAVKPISDRPAFRRMTDVELPAAFVPPGQSTASAMKAAWTVSNSPVRSTALAIVPVGEWLVKFRYSSRVHEAASLVRRLDEMIARVGWPATLPPALAAAAITDCSAPLKLDGASKPAKQDGGSALADALAHTVEGKLERKRIDWCRERGAETTLPIYRPVGTDDSYLAILSDSGRAIWVRPSLGGLVSSNRKPSWSVSLMLAGEAINYRNRDRLPPFAQLDEIMDGVVVSTLTTWGKREIKIDPSQMK